MTEAEREHLLLVALNEATYYLTRAIPEQDEEEDIANYPRYVAALTEHHTDMVRGPRYRAALAHFLNPTGHTDACMERRSWGVRACLHPCGHARAALGLTEDDR